MRFDVVILYLFHYVSWTREGDITLSAAESCLQHNKLVTKLMNWTIT